MEKVLLFKKTLHSKLPDPDSLGIKKVQKRLKRPKGLNEKFVSKMAKTENYFKYGNKLEKGRGGSPGLVVMGGDSCSKVCGFKSGTIY